jgi:hypothetical protein
MSDQQTSIDVEAETAAFAARVVAEQDAEIETHRQQLMNVTRLLCHWQTKSDRLTHENQSLRADLARARAALVKVEWAAATHVDGEVVYYCPGCGNHRDPHRVHHPSCPIRLFFETAHQQEPGAGR